MLRIDGATVRFGDRVVLDHADLDLGPSETVAVLGPSGSGKTTLLRAVAGLQPLDAGRVCWDDDDLASVPAHQRRFGLMFQEYALFPHRDVQGNVEFGLRMAGLDRAARAQRVEETLDLVGLAGQRTQRVASLSGGEQQRVALARALAVAPRLLMLDEPLGALDREWRIRLLAEIRTMLDDAQLPALYVTHDHDEAFAIASRVAVMRDGHIVQIGSPSDVWRSPVDAGTATFFGFGPTVDAVARDGVLETPWGVIAGNAAWEGPVDVVLRPDAVRIDPHGAIAAVVERVRFTGTHVDVTVRPDRGPALSLEVAARDAPSLGDVVRITLDREALLVYAHPAD